MGTSAKIRASDVQRPVQQAVQLGITRWKSDWRSSTDLQKKAICWRSRSHLLVQQAVQLQQVGAQDLDTCQQSDLAVRKKKYKFAPAGAAGGAAAAGGVAPRASPTAAAGVAAPLAPPPGSPAPPA